LRRIQGLPPEEEIINNSPMPPQRCWLDPSDTFLLLSQTEIIDINPLEVNVSKPKEVIFEDLGDEEFAPHFNPPLPRDFPLPFIQVPPPRSDLNDSIPPHWATMDDTLPLLGSRAHATPILEIVTRGIFHLGMSNQMMGMIQYTIVTLTNKVASLVINTTQISREAASLSSKTNSFPYRMSPMDALNTLVSS
jgi:hypothetical protein